MDISGIFTTLLPILDYYITFFTKLLTNFAASLGFDLELPEADDDQNITSGDAQ